ncbi:MAG: hypothetical protein V1799_07220 [bacterium]
MRTSASVKRIVSIFIAVGLTLIINSAITIAAKVGSEHSPYQTQAGVTTGPGTTIPTDIPKPYGVTTGPGTPIPTDIPKPSSVITGPGTPIPTDIPKPL